MNRPENNDPPRDRIVGPFTVQQSGLGGYTIHDNDQTTIAWVMGEISARRVAGAMNLAHDCGLLD